jgi:hypothetical protein
MGKGAGIGLADRIFALQRYIGAFDNLASGIKISLNNLKDLQPCERFYFYLNWRLKIRKVESRISEDEALAGPNGPLILVREMYDKKGMNAFMRGRRHYMPLVAKGLSDLAQDLRNFAKYLQRQGS